MVELYVDCVFEWFDFVMVCFDVCFVVVIVEGGCCFVVVDFFVMVVGVCEIEF